METVTISCPKSKNSKQQEKDYLQKLEANRPEGYTSVIPGQTIDMLGATEFWVVYSNNPDPFLTRIPQDYVDYGDGKVLALRPKEWGYPLYYKVV